MNYDVIIIGGGASGLTAAVTAAARGLKTAIIEHKDRLGKKILATGNGKCNYTNLYQSPECYRGTHPEFAMELMRQFDHNQTIAFFKSLGIYPKVRNGYVYPNSEQAAAVADVLSMEAKRLGVDVFLSEHVTKVEKRNDGFLILATVEPDPKEAKAKKATGKGQQGFSKAAMVPKTAQTIEKPIEKRYEAKNVILAAGGCAAPKQGSDGSGFELAKSLGHTIVSPFPALVQLRASEKFLKTLSGVRLEAKGTIFANEQTISEESGEFLFTDYGISGIPIMQMSRYAVEAVNQNRKTRIILDFFPDLSVNEMNELLLQRLKNGSQKTMEEMFIGLLNNKLSYVLLMEAGIDPLLSAKKVKEQEIKKLVSLLKQFTLTITGSNGFDMAQVSAGGVLTSEIDVTTLESKKVKGLYLTGEVVDIDGTCGGYNLQWAWSSGSVAGNHAGGVR